MQGNMNVNAVNGIHKADQPCKENDDAVNRADWQPRATAERPSYSRRGKCCDHENHAERPFENAGEIHLAASLLQQQHVVSFRVVQHGPLLLCLHHALAANGSQGGLQVRHFEEKHRLVL